MSETLLLGVGIILSMAAWKYAAKRTYLDEARDSLFDLRDCDLKTFFASSKMGLNDPLYVRMRMLINNLLRYTEKASLMGFFITMVALAKDEKRLIEIGKQHDREFDSDNPEVAEFCQYIRTEANLVMMRYMIRTSVVGQVLRLIAYGILFIQTILTSIRNYHKPLWAATCSAATGAAIITSVVSHVAPGVSSAAVQNAVEARAMRQI